MKGSISYFVDVCSSYRVDSNLNDIEKAADKLEELIDNLPDSCDTSEVREIGEKHVEALRRAHQDLVSELSDYETEISEDDLTNEQREELGEWCSPEPKKALEQALTYLRDHEVSIPDFNFVAEGLGFWIIRVDVNGDKTLDVGAYGKVTP